MKQRVRILGHFKKKTLKIRVTNTFILPVHLCTMRDVYNDQLHVHVHVALTFLSPALYHDQWQACMRMVHFIGLDTQLHCPYSFVPFAQFTRELAAAVNMLFVQHVQLVCLGHGAV